MGIRLSESFGNSHFFKSTYIMIGSSYPARNDSLVAPKNICGICDGWSVDGEIFVLTELAPGNRINAEMILGSFINKVLSQDFRVRV